MLAPAARSHLLSPFSGLRSPLSLMSPAIIRDMAGFGAWSPINGDSPQFPFSPSSAASLTENRAQFLNLLSPVLTK
jgi:hypothetical protein